VSVEDDRLALLAHEVRSPVAALAAIAEAYPAADDVTRKRLVELAVAAVAGLERLLVDASPTSLRPEVLDVSRLTVDAAETAAVAGAPVVAKVEAGLMVEGDPERLRQALDNLIANAIAHSPAGRTVRVTAGREAHSVVIAVADEGDGIAPEDLDRVFAPGVRLTTARPGSGLGLAVVRTIARGHGGDVEIESRPGQGATFRLVLPVASDEG
jgi:signal transduction histidine kinase